MPGLGTILINQAHILTGFLGSGSEPEKRAVEFLGRTTALGRALGTATTPDPMEARLSGNFIHCPEEAGAESTVRNNWLSAD